jgi:hypothetical protein
MQHEPLHEAKDLLPNLATTAGQRKTKSVLEEEEAALDEGADSKPLLLQLAPCKIAGDASQSPPHATLERKDEPAPDPLRRSKGRVAAASPLLAATAGQRKSAAC